VRKDARSAEQQTRSAFVGLREDCEYYILTVSLLLRPSYLNSGEKKVVPKPFDVPVDLLIEKLAKYLKENIGEVSPPTWSLTAKTGSHRERPPQQADWWFHRCASLLRKLYIHAPLGIQRLRVEYGGRSRHGRRIEHSRKSGGSSIREPLQQLEKAGLVTKEEKKGRKLTREGVGLLNRVSAEVLKETKSAGEGQQ